MPSDKDRNARALEAAGAEAMMELFLTYEARQDEIRLLLGSDVFDKLARWQASLVRMLENLLASLGIEPDTKLESMLLEATAGDALRDHTRATSMLIQLAVLFGYQLGQRRVALDNWQVVEDEGPTLDNS